MEQSGKTFRLRVLARTALTRFQGDVNRAMRWLDEQVIAAADPALERALAAYYRTYALRRVININLSDLEEEGILPRQREEPAAAEQSREQTWAHARVHDMEQRAEDRRRNYLDTFLIHGEPIGDLTPEAVLARADLHERDARFMRLMASGVPHGHRIREFVTPEEAAERWRMAQEMSPPRDLRREQIVKMLTRGRGLKDDEYRAAQARVAELAQLNDRSAWDEFELDALARVMSEYEDEQR